MCLSVGVNYCAAFTILYFYWIPNYVPWPKNFNFFFFGVIRIHLELLEVFENRIFKIFQPFLLEKEKSNVFQRNPCHWPMLFSDQKWFWYDRLALLLKSLLVNGTEVDYESALWSDLKYISSYLLCGISYWKLDPCPTFYVESMNLLRTERHPAMLLPWK